MSNMEDHDFDSLQWMLIAGYLEDYVREVPMSYMRYAQLHYTIDKCKRMYMNEPKGPSYDPYFEAAQEDIFEFLKHGDAEHQRWLRKAIRYWFEGKPRPEKEEE